MKITFEIVRRKPLARPKYQLTVNIEKQIYSISTNGFPDSTTFVEIAENVYRVNNFFGMSFNGFFSKNEINKFERFLDNVPQILRDLENY